MQVSLGQSNIDDEIMGDRSSVVGKKIKIGRRKNQFSNAGGTVSRPPSSSSSLISGNLVQFHILRAFIGVNFRSVNHERDHDTEILFLCQVLVLFCVVVNGELFIQYLLCC